MGGRRACSILVGSLTATGRGVGGCVTIATSSNRISLLHATHRHSSSRPQPPGDAMVNPPPHTGHPILDMTLPPILNMTLLPLLPAPAPCHRVVTFGRCGGLWDGAYAIGRPEEGRGRGGGGGGRGQGAGAVGGVGRWRWEGGRWAMDDRGGGGCRLRAGAGERGWILLLKACTIRDVTGQVEGVWMASGA
jgi:hypothetical protein